MDKKQKIIAGVVVAVVAIILLLVFRQSSVQAPAVPLDTTTKTTKEPAAVPTLPAGPLSADDAVKNISKEIDEDAAAFEKETGDASAVDGESKALNDIDQTYDQNQL